MAKLNASDQIVARYFYGTKSNVPDFMWKNNGYYRIISDHLGSVRLVIKTDGTIAQRLSYDAFGNVLQNTSPGFQSFAFAGGLYDEDTKLTRFGARDYESEIGRWTAKDPIGFSGGKNLFVYVDNEPINYIDITGFDSMVKVRSEYKWATGYRNGEAYNYRAYKLDVYTNTEKWYNVVLDFVGLRSPAAEFWVGRDSWGINNNKALIEGDGFLLTSQGETGGPRGWLLVSPTQRYNDTFCGKGPNGTTTWNGLSFHPGYPKNSAGCITFGTQENFNSFKNIILPDLQAHNPVSVKFYKSTFLYLPHVR